MLRKKMRQMQNKTVCANKNGAKKVSDYAQKEDETDAKFSVMERELMPHVGLMHHSSWGEKKKREKRFIITRK